MFGSEILDIAVGLVLVYLLLSLIASAVAEVIEAFRKKRASDLERGIRTLLADPEGTGLAGQFYDHPLVSGLTLSGYDPGKISGGRYATGSKLPSYIPSRSFALVLMDFFLPTNAAEQGKVATPTLASLRATVDTIDNEHIKRVLGSMVNTVGSDHGAVREELEAWYDSGMDRVSGWYKRYAQWVLLAVGFAITVVVNADTVAISRSLAQDEVTRGAMLDLVRDHLGQQRSAGAPLGLALTQEASPTTPPQNLTSEQLAESLDGLQRVGLPLGWNLEDPRVFPGKDLFAWVLKLLGWLLTALAISLGAPFWFDLLNKFMVVRSTVKPYEKSSPEPPVDG